MKKLIIAILITFSINALGEEPEIEKVDQAIQHLMKSAPRREIMRNRIWRAELASLIVQTSKEYPQIDPFLLTMIIYCESSFFPGSVGKLGEEGLGQVTKQNQRTLKCNMDTPAGQLDCMARQLIRCFEICPTPYGALTRYGTKNRAKGENPCKFPKGSSVDNKIKYRLRIYNKIKSL